MRIICKSHETSLQRYCTNKMWLNLLLSTLLAAALCLNANAYPTFQAKIPNGDSVPNPCNRSTIWPGVGHQNVYGSGPRNPFGLDFAANKFVWDRTMCQKDSDGDGKTNGEELGDPNCIWTAGTIPTSTTSLSHPGVCEPLNSSLCAGKNIWMNCMPGKFNCSAINESGAQNYTLRFPPTPIPTKETTYICYQFKLPNDSVSDIIAIEPIIDNALILHHMMLYACTDPPIATPVDTAYECGMDSGKTCRSLIGFWVAGDTGKCLNSQLGFRIGPGGFQYAVLHLHWNNPVHWANQTDSSGMTIYHTTQLRPNRGQIAVVGQFALGIPPGQSDVTFTGSCSSLCSRHFPHSIFLTSSYLHMHLLGKSGEIRLSRNGKLVQILDSVAHYDYNAPTLSEFETPIEVQPGDEIQVECVYDSTKRNTTTNFGEATSDEMCFGNFAYYPPLDDLGNCAQVKDINLCNNKFDAEFESCDIKTLTKLLALLPSVCVDNCTSTPCALIMDGMQATECFNFPEMMIYINIVMPNNTAIFSRCAKERPPKPPNSPCTQSPFGLSNSSVQGTTLGLGVVFTLMAIATYHSTPFTSFY